MQKGGGTGPFSERVDELPDECLVVGVGFHPFGRFPGRSLKELGAVAVLEAVKDAGITLADVETAYVGNSYAGLLSGQESVRGQVILRHVGQVAYLS